MRSQEVALSELSLLIRGHSDMNGDALSWFSWRNKYCARKEHPCVAGSLGEQTEIFLLPQFPSPLQPTSHESFFSSINPKCLGFSLFPPELLTVGCGCFWTGAALRRASKAETQAEGCIRWRVEVPGTALGFYSVIHTFDLFFVVVVVISIFLVHFNMTKRSRDFGAGDSNLCPSLKHTWPWGSPNFSQL